MTKLIEQTAMQLHEQLVAGSISSRELVEAYLSHITTHDGQVGAFLSVNADRAMEQASAIDQRRTAGQPVGPLAGLPVAVKDLLCTAGEATTCASRMLEHFVPPYDATVIAKLRSADAVLLGKTNLDEFAMGSSTENSALGKTRNPWNLEHVPGGSSGGAAACVAAGMAPLSLGTDTGGSIRQPASYCGVTGLKPTYGRVSRYGLIAFASSLDQIGPLSATAEDAALLLEAIAGHDRRDSTSAPAEVPAYRQNLDQSLNGLRIGIVPEHFAEGIDTQVETATREAIKVYQSLGATVQEIDLPHSKYGIATYYVIAPCEASSNLARYDGAHYGYRTDERAMLADLAEQRKAQAASAESEASSNGNQLDSPLVRMYRQSRAEGFGPEVKRRIMLGTYALSAGYYDAYYLKALKVRRLIRNDYDSAFKQVDVILGPTTPRPAFASGTKQSDPLSMYLEDIYTVTANLAGIPAISFPCGQTQAGLPIGLQLQAPPMQEERLLRVAHQFQQATDWHTLRPTL